MLGISEDDASYESIILQFLSFNQQLFNDKLLKNSFLLHGKAGSGKSTLAKKIEAVIWKLMKIELNFILENKEEINQIKYILIKK